MLVTETLKQFALCARYYFRKLRRPSSVTLKGVQLSFPQNISAGLRNALYSENYEVSELNALKAHLGPETRVLELGSSIGFLTISMCKMIGSDRVTAIEANPEVAVFARRNFGLNGVSPKLLIGIADAEGRSEKTSFYIYDDFWSSSTIERANAGGGRRIECDVLPVNSIIAENDINVLVCDIEGGETALLPKLKLDNLRTIIAEFHPEVSSPRDIQKTILHILQQDFSIDIRASTSDTLVFSRI